MKSIVAILIVFLISYFLFIVPEDEPKLPPWNPKKREIIKLELNNQNWSDNIMSPAGKCILYERPAGQKITVQYKETPNSNWKFYNSTEKFIPDQPAGLRFRAVYSRGFMFYEIRPAGRCVKDVLQGVGEDIRIRIVLPKNTWSHGVDVKTDKQCMKWWMDRGKGFKVQFKQSKYASWKAWPDQRKDYLGWKPLTTWRFKPTIAGGWVEYSLRPAGQCRD